MPLDIHIVASCTNRKRAPIPAELRLREIRAPDIRTRARRWWSHLSTHSHSTTHAQDLYAGDHWRVIMGLPSLAARAHLHPHLWVASAGYGLIQSNTAIRPYSATFSRGHSDSIILGVTVQGMAAAHRQWWQALSEESAPASSEPRSINRLPEKNPHACILVVASSAYVAALEDDLRQAAGVLHRPERLIIISTPSPLANGALAPHWIPSSANLQAQIGGARLSLHARVARDILQRAQTEAGFLDAPRVREYYERLTQRSAPPKRFERTPMTDERVREFIVRALHTEALSCSATLRQLRDSGLTCEQQRFKRIFTELQERT
ncbi:hypothetical protein [Archangium sp.]|uniref:hypothetical protein n=1 Tax=Archangium sp. TaxID=1872627 RepID=UPI002D638946|nr:hypothetical protein [Archangium sp.]HYO53858.1 hypothetical protein [Archangium sp.]